MTDHFNDWEDVWLNWSVETQTESEPTNQSSRGQTERDRERAVVRSSWPLKFFIPKQRLQAAPAQQPHSTTNNAITSTTTQKTTTTTQQHHHYQQHQQQQTTDNTTITTDNTTVTTSCSVPLWFWSGFSLSLDPVSGAVSSSCSLIGSTQMCLWCLSIE